MGSAHRIFNAQFEIRFFKTVFELLVLKSVIMVLCTNE